MDLLETQAPESQQVDEPRRKPYTPPTLKDFGSVAEVTRARGGFPEYFMGS